MPLSVNVVIIIELGIGVGEGVGVGAAVGFGVVVGVGLGGEEGFDVGLDVAASVKVNGLLVPEWLPSVTVIVTLEPLEVIVTEVDPTPPTKAAIVVGLIEPAEDVKDGVPT